MCFGDFVERATSCADLYLCSYYPINLPFGNQPATTGSSACSEPLLATVPPSFRGGGELSAVQRDTIEMYMSTGSAPQHERVLSDEYDVPPHPLPSPSEGRGNYKESRLEATPTVN